MSFLGAARTCLALGYLTPVVVIGAEWRTHVFGPHGEGGLRAVLSIGALMLLSAFARGYVRLDAEAGSGVLRAPWLLRVARLGLYGPPVAVALVVAVAWLAGSRS